MNPTALLIGDVLCHREWITQSYGALVESVAVLTPCLLLPAAPWISLVRA